MSPNPRRLTRLRWGALGLVVVLVGCAVFAAVAWKPAIEPVAPVLRSGFDPAEVRRGQQLAAVGNCAGCHTALGGVPFAGGTPLRTPFGTVHGSNITPDPQDGIGRWSEAAFQRAMREGVSRDGHLLYPAFPYNHFTRMQDPDIAALYAYLMTRDPVPGRPPANDLFFPFNLRPLLAGWNLLYLDAGPLPPDATHDAEWRRGAYLADALGHCAACHAPRNALGAEKRGQPFAGGSVDGWRATPLDASTPSPVAWARAALISYLRTGLADDHAIAAGPMQDVTVALSHATPEDVAALATYVASLPGDATAERTQRDAEARRKAAAGPLAALKPDELGARVYADNCARCHDAGRGLSSGNALNLPLAQALYLSAPDNLLHIVREGIRPAADGVGRRMPGFDAMQPDQLVALAAWLRATATDQPPWADLDKSVARAMKETP